MPRCTEAPKQRVEWDTRDTMNNRLWSDIQTAGPNLITSATLAAHPNAGAMPWMPSAARIDQRSYNPIGNDAAAYYPDAPAPRPGSARQDVMMPPHRNLQHNAWSTNLDLNSDPQNMSRELRAVVKEDGRFRRDNVSSQLADRTFQHQWVSDQLSNQIMNSRLHAAEALRPQQDDFRTSFSKSRPT